MARALTMAAMHRAVIGLVVVLAACTESISQEASAYCVPICRCIAALPAAQRECALACEAVFVRNPPPGLCVDCVIAQADRCSTLIDACGQVCGQDVSLRSYRERDESGIEDHP